MKRNVCWTLKLTDTPFSNEIRAWVKVDLKVIFAKVKFGWDNLYRSILYDNVGLSFVAPWNLLAVYHIVREFKKSEWFTKDRTFPVKFIWYKKYRISNRIFIQCFCRFSYFNRHCVHFWSISYIISLDFWYLNTVFYADDDVVLNKKPAHLRK